MNACPKPVRIKSKALTRSARGKTCTLRLKGCTHDDAIFAHYRGVWSLGIGTKPPDFIGAYSCASCHARQEAHDADAADMLRALIETQILMAREGLLAVRGWTP